MLGEAINAQNKPRAVGTDFRNGKRKRGEEASSGQEIGDIVGSDTTTLGGKRFLPTAPVQVDLEGEDDPAPTNDEPAELDAVVQEQRRQTRRAKFLQLDQRPPASQSPRDRGRIWLPCSTSSFPCRISTRNPWSRRSRRTARRTIPWRTSTTICLKWLARECLKPLWTRCRAEAVVRRCVEEVRVVPLGESRRRWRPWRDSAVWLAWRTSEWGWGLRTFCADTSQSSHPRSECCRRCYPSRCFILQRHSLTLPFPIPTYGAHRTEVTQQTGVMSSDTSTGAPAKTQPGSRKHAPTCQWLLPHCFRTFTTRPYTSRASHDGPRRRGVAQGEAPRGCPCETPGEKEARKLARKRWRMGSARI